VCVCRRVRVYMSVLNPSGHSHLLLCVYVKERMCVRKREEREKESTKERVCAHACVLHVYCTHDMCCSVLQCVAVCCSALQCVAVCCSARHVYCTHDIHVYCTHDMCCSVLQCVAVCCSVLQCIAHTTYMCIAHMKDRLFKWPS